MAKCDQGYLCERCGEPVTNIIESSLYVRYVLGEVQLHELFAAPERHLRCDLQLSAYIEHEKFPQADAQDLAAVTDPAKLSVEQRQARKQRVTAAWLRLREVVGSGVPITEYPLPKS